MTPYHWMVASLLLFIGATLIMDPDSCARIPRHAAFGLREFETRLFQSRAQWKRQWRDGVERDPSPGAKAALQLAGVAIIALALAIVAVS